VTEHPPEAKKPGSKRIYILWGVALTLLLAAGLFCWLVVMPILETREVVRLFGNSRLFFNPEKAIARLDGHERAARRLLFHLRHYGRLGEGKREWEAAIMLLTHCEMPAGEPPFRDREISSRCQTLGEWSEGYAREMVAWRRLLDRSLQSVAEGGNELVPTPPRAEATREERLRWLRVRMTECDESKASSKERAERCKRWAKWMAPDRK